METSKSKRKAMEMEREVSEGEKRREGEMQDNIDIKVCMQCTSERTTHK